MIRSLRRAAAWMIGSGPTDQAGSRRIVGRLAIYWLLPALWMAWYVIDRHGVLSHLLDIHGHQCLGLSPATWWRLPLYPFEHGDVGHLVGNTVLMLVGGTLPLFSIGARRALGWFVAFTIVVGGCYLLLDGDGMVGASGPVRAMTVFGTVLLAWNRAPGRWQRIAWWCGIGQVAFYLGNDVVTVIAQRSGVALVAHIAGLVCGAIAGLALGPYLRRSGSPAPSPAPLRGSREG